jgi:flagellar motility protein MotE (MotC chaperone)/sporulation protein YlmC with PRC-barrel domain
LIHLSEVLGLPVLDASRAPLGHVDDLLVESSQGAVARLVWRRRGQLSSVPWSQVATLSPEKRKVILAAGAEPQPFAGGPGEPEMLSLRREVLDRQIIDIHGRKVVRVNDIVLEGGPGPLSLRRVEVGLAGAVRRLLAGILAPRLIRRLAAGLSQQAISWDYVGLVDPRSATIRLKVHQQLARLHPADLADIIEDLGRVERQAVVNSLDDETAAQALSEAIPSVQATVVEEIQVERAADILEEMPPDEAADILGDLPEERSRAVLQAMETEDAQDVRELLSFPDNSAGGLMTSEFFSARDTWTVDETIRALRGLDEDLLEDLDELPVVTVDGRLAGVVRLARLVAAEAEAPVLGLCRQESARLGPAAGFAEVLATFARYRARLLPVVDEFGALVGVISIEDVVRRIAGSRG